MANTETDRQLREANDKLREKEELLKWYKEQHEVQKTLLEQAGEQIKEYDETFNRFRFGAILTAIVHRTVEEVTYIVTPAGTIGVAKHPEVAPGDIVRVDGKTMTIIEKISEEPVEPGRMVRVKRVMDEHTLELESPGTDRVLVYQNPQQKAIAEDWVVVDRTGTFVVKNLGPDQNDTARFELEGDTAVSWDDIGGLTAAKRDMIEAIELPFKHPDLFRHFGQKPVKGVLLYGPPGCGKTMLGKAAATALSETHGKRTSSGFIYVKGPEILDMWVGSSEKNIREIFDKARAHKKKHGFPALIFIDEAEAILGSRGRSSMGRDMSSTVVPAFLAEADGMDESAAVVVLATNRPEDLDPAVTRDGRIDRRVGVTRPDRKGAEDIFKLYFKNRPTELSVDEMSALAATDMFDEHHRLLQVMTESGKKVEMSLGDFANGAMIAGIVGTAASIALHESIASRKKGKVTSDHVRRAVLSTVEQNRKIDRTEELRELADRLGERVTGIRRL